VDGTPFVETAEELNDRQNEAFGEESGARFLENCSEHKDNIYTWQIRSDLCQATGRFQAPNSKVCFIELLELGAYER